MAGAITEAFEEVSAGDLISGVDAACLDFNISKTLFESILQSLAVSVFDGLLFNDEVTQVAEPSILKV